MDNIRICIGSLCNKNSIEISNTHMGDTECFYIFDLSADGNSSFIEKRENHAIDLTHSTQAKMKEILNIVRDAQILVALQKSPNFVKIAQKTKYQPVVVKKRFFKEILNEISENREKIIEVLKKREAGQHPEVIIL